MPCSAQIANNFGVARKREAFPLTRSWSPGSNATGSLKPATCSRRPQASHALTTASKSRNETACPVKPLLFSDRHVQPFASGSLRALSRSARKAPIAVWNFSIRPLRFVLAPRGRSFPVCQLVSEKLCDRPGALAASLRVERCHGCNSKAVCFLRAMSRRHIHAVSPPPMPCR